MDMKIRRALPKIAAVSVASAITLTLCGCEKTGADLEWMFTSAKLRANLLSLSDLTAVI